MCLTTERRRRRRGHGVASDGIGGDLVEDEMTEGSGGVGSDVGEEGMTKGKKEERTKRLPIAPEEIPPEAG